MVIFNNQDPWLYDTTQNTFVQYEDNKGAKPKIFTNYQKTGAFNSKKEYFTMSTHWIVYKVSREGKVDEISNIPPVRKNESIEDYLN
jgi:hypothetical protein